MGSNEYILIKKEVLVFNTSLQSTGNGIRTRTVIPDRGIVGSMGYKPIIVYITTKIRFFKTVFSAI